MSSDTRRALVTGATGYIGSHLVRRLLHDGWTVHVVVEPALGLQLLGDLADKLGVHPHDGTTGAMLTLVRQAAPDTVFHLASCFLSEHEPADVERLIRSNVLFGTQLLEAMAQAGVSRLVNTGTSWQHYRDADYEPVCLYAATKQAFEAVMAFYSVAHGLRCITLKLFDTYGPGDPRRKLFSFLREAAARGTPVAMSPGEQRLDLVYIDDVVEAFVVAARRLETMPAGLQESFAIGSGASWPLKDIVKLYGELAGQSLPIVFGGRAYREREVMTPWSGGASLPGWRARIGLAEGLRRVLAAAERP